MLRYDNDLDPPFLNIENSLCWIALSEDYLIFAVFKYRLSLAYLGKKYLGIECSLICLVCHVWFGPRWDAPINQSGRGRPK